MNKWLPVALRLAQHSHHAKHRMAALVVSGGRVLIGAVNGKRTGRHAEIRALSRDIDFTGATMIIVRMNGNGISTPCQTCFRLIKECGIKHIIFTIGPGQIVKFKVKDHEFTEFRNMEQ